MGLRHVLPCSADHSSPLPLPDFGEVAGEQTEEFSSFVLDRPLFLSDR